MLDLPINYHLIVRGGEPPSITFLPTDFEFCKILIGGLIMNTLKWI